MLCSFLWGMWYLMNDIDDDDGDDDGDNDAGDNDDDDDDHLWPTHSGGE